MSGEADASAMAPPLLGAGQSCARCGGAGCQQRGRKCWRARRRWQGRCGRGRWNGRGSASTACYRTLSAVCSKELARLDVKLSFLDALPYKIARCRDVAVARETRAGFDRCLCTGVEQPDLVSCHCLSPGTKLRRCWDEFCCTGVLPHNISMALREYEWVKLDEAEVEGVHRDVRAEHSRAHAARLPFVVSTVRLGENVGAWRRAQVTGGRSWQRLLWCWRH